MQIQYQAYENKTFGLPRPYIFASLPEHMFWTDARTYFVFFDPTGYIFVLLPDAKAWKGWIRWLWEQLGASGSSWELLGASRSVLTLAATGGTFPQGLFVRDLLHMFVNK